MRIRTIMGVFLLALAAVFAISGCGDTKSEGGTEGAKAEVSSAKNFTVTLLDGSQLSLSDLKGKVAIVDVWDTWCPPCKAEIPHFIELYDQYKDKGLVIVGLAGARYGKEAVEQFIKDYNINYVNGLFNEDFNAKYGPIRSIPTTFVFDQKGNVYKSYLGYRDKSVFEADIRALLEI